MPRKKNAIPARLDGRASLAHVVEGVSEEAAALAGRLRKPASLIRDRRVAEAAASLQEAAQLLSDLAVGIKLEDVAIREAGSPRELQTAFFDTLEAAPVN